ncbi:hypothetical protein [Infirmifilum sp. SLHALR2]
MSCMRTALLFALSLLLIVATLKALPVLYINYAEVLEWNGNSWRSTYMSFSGETLSFTTSGKIVVVRNDPSSGKQPVDVQVDGYSYVPPPGTGVLWYTVVLQLDGLPHTVSVRYADTQSRTPVLAFFTVPGGSTTRPINITVPRVPGFVSLGIKAEVIILGGNTSGIMDKPYFTVNLSTITVQGETLTVLEVLVPFENVSLKGGFISVRYSYLYGLQGLFGFKIPLPPYPEEYVFASSPAPMNATQVINILKGNPLKVILAAVNSSEVEFPRVSYSVSLDVKQPSSLCGATDLTYRVLGQSLKLGPSGRAVTLSGDNTTLTFRFFARGVSLVDVVVTTPPPTLSVSPPLYTLGFTLYDKTGGRVRNAYFTVYSSGRVVTAGAVKDGEGLVCPLPPGEYIIVAYLANSVIAKTSVKMTGDAYLPIITNTTGVQVTLLRTGSGELIENFTLFLRSGAVNYSAEGLSGKARIEGVLPGVYTYEVYVSGDKVFTGVIEVSDLQNTFVLSIPVYRLRVQLVGALNQPLSGFKVSLTGAGVRREAVTDSSGRADFGLIPRGSYKLAIGERTLNLTIESDSFKLVELDVIACLSGLTITTSHVEFALLILFILFVVLAVRRVAKGFKKESPHIVEVNSEIWGRGEAA